MAQKCRPNPSDRPVDFGAGSRPSGGFPLPKRLPQRQAYSMMELKGWRDHLGIKLTLETKFFPGRRSAGSELASSACATQGRMGADAIKVAHAAKGLWTEEKENPATRRP